MKKAITAVIFLLALGAGAYFFFFKGEEGEPPEPPELSLAHKMLVNPPEGNERILPHVVENKTYFKESLNYLVKGGYAPQVESHEESGAPVIDLTAQAKMAHSRGSVSFSKDDEKMKQSAAEFGNRPARKMEDWTGLVLKPESAIVSKGYNTAVSIPRIEAHPLRDDRIRVWSRIQNETEESLKVDVACFFQYEGMTEQARPVFTPIDVPSNSFRDINFVSETSGVESYTILVR